MINRKVISIDIFGCYLSFSSTENEKHKYTLKLFLKSIFNTMFSYKTMNGNYTVYVLNPQMKL